MNLIKIVALNSVLFDFTLKRNSGFHFITQPPKNPKFYGLNCKLFFEGIKKLKKNDGLILMFSETQVSLVTNILKNFWQKNYKKINKPPSWSYQCNTSQLDIFGRGLKNSNFQILFFRRLWNFWKKFWFWNPFKIFSFRWNFINYTIKWRKIINSSWQIRK